MNRTAGFGATIGGVHTLSDLGLVITNGDVDEPPEPKTSLVEVPGSSNVIDLTEALTGRVEYGTRKLKLSMAGERDVDAWAPFMASLRHKLHGKRCDIVLDSEPNLAYSGRVSIGTLTRQGRAGTFDIEAECDGYRYETAPTDGTWLWDPFSFESGVVREYGGIEVDGERTVEIAGTQVTTVPVIHLSDVDPSVAPYLVYLGMKRDLHEGRNRIPEIRIAEEGGTIELHGKFRCDIDFKGGVI